MSTMDELAKASGFADEKEMAKMIASVDFSDPTTLVAFQHWKMNDGTKAGLMEVINGTYIRDRFGGSK